ncbi:MAG: hypothetical protein QOD06_2814 [Candidatus Binatota bacterium]|nr:hypothetical protein [Candidatus Binatota bacterium]
MNELWRILRPGAAAELVAPYYTSVRAVQDPTHKRFVSEPLFWYFDREWREANRLGHYPMTCDFTVERVELTVDPAFARLSPRAFEEAKRHQWNVVEDIFVTLRKPRVIALPRASD